MFPSAHSISLDGCGGVYCSSGGVPFELDESLSIVLEVLPPSKLEFLQLKHPIKTSIIEICFMILICLKKLILKSLTLLPFCLWIQMKLLFCGFPEKS